MTSAPAIGFEYRPSRWLGGILIPVSTLALAAVWLSDMPWVAQALLTTGVAIASRRSLIRFDRSPVVGAGLGRDGGWILRVRDGHDVPAVLVSSRVISDRYIWLLLRASGLGSVPLLLAPDNSDADIRRRLRMRLALASAPAADGAGTLSASRGPTV